MPTRREVLVGLMFFASLATFFTLALVLAGQTMEIGKRTRDIVIGFDSIAGVTRGTPVMLNGQEVGQVVEMLRNRETSEIEVTCRIDEEIQLKSDYKIEVQAGLFGGSQIHINEVQGAKGYANLSEKLRGHALGSPFTALARVSSKLDAIADEAAEIVHQINLTAIAINDPEAGLIGRLLQDRALANTVSGVFETINDTVRTYNLVGEEVLQITRTIQTGDGLLPTLLTDSSLSDTVRQMIEDLNASTADVRAITADTRSIISKVERQEGLVGYLIGDPNGKAHADAILRELAEAMPEINGTMANLNSITYKIDTGQGAMGKIVNDDALYDQLMNTLTTATRSLEDLRETTPIIAFSSLLFQAFQ